MRYINIIEFFNFYAYLPFMISDKNESDINTWFIYLYNL